MFRKSFFEKVYPVKGKSHSIAPRCRVQLRYHDSHSAAAERLDRVMTAIAEVFHFHKYGTQKTFTLAEFESELNERMGEKLLPHDKYGLLLDIFTAEGGESTAFRASRNQIQILRCRSSVKPGGTEYYVHATNAQLPSTFRKMIAECEPNADNETFRSYYPILKDAPIKNMPLMRICQLLELASYEITGSERAEIFVRINDPLKLCRLAACSYTNQVLRALNHRHERSRDILDAFFRTALSDEGRWQLIEEYFLGNEPYVNRVLNLTE